MALPTVAIPDRPRSIPVQEDRFTTSDGTGLAVWRSGPADAEITVVLTHGWTLDHRSWDVVTPQLLATETTIRVITYDHRGHGLSDRLARGSGTLERIADDLAELIEAVTPAGPLVLAGHSMGGMTIMTLAERHPTVAQRVEGLGLVATSAGPFLRRLRRNEYFLDSFVPRAFDRLDVAARRPSSDRVARLNARLGMFGRAPRRADLDAAIAQLRLAGPGTTAEFGVSISQHDRLAALRPFAAVPTAVMVGTLDRQCPVRHGKALAAALPAAALTVLPGAGHMLPYERATEVTGRLRALVHAAGRQRAVTTGA